MASRRYWQFACLITLLLGQPVQAMYIPAEDRVTVNGLTWAQVDLFPAQTWNEVNAQCPAGLCGPGSTLWGFDLDGWLWAGAAQVSALFNYYLASDGVSGPDLMDPADPDDSYSIVSNPTVDWMYAIRDDFRSNDYDHTGGYYLSGLASDPVGQRYGADNVYFGDAGRRSRVWASSAFATQPDNRASGAWFYCTQNCPPTAAVPLPPAWSLTLLALGLLAWRRAGTQK